MTWRVTDTSGDKFLLRLYSPISRFLAGRWQRADAVRSEMAWLAHLHDTAGIPVQEPIRTREGDWLALVGIEAGHPVPCVLLRWLEGESPKRPLVWGEAELAGDLLARLHRAGEEWSPPQEFARPRYDADQLRGALDEAHGHVDQGGISAGEFSLLEEGARKTCSIMDQLGDSRGNWGFIHGDYNPANLILDAGRASPIDFSECGFGHYMRDIGMFLLRAGPEKRAFLEAYRAVRALPSDLESLADAFAIAEMIQWLAFTASLPDRHAKVAGIVNNFCVERWRKFLEGEPFILA